VSHEVEREPGRGAEPPPRAARDQAARRLSALAAMLAAARSGEKHDPSPMLAAGAGRGDPGRDLADVLRQEWGVYSEAPGVS